MNMLKRLRLLVCVLFLLSGPQAASGDSVATLPEAWAGKLQPVALPDIEGQREDVKASLTAARNAVREALQKPDAPVELAAAYGELGGLYQNYLLRQAAEACFENARRLDPDEFRWAYYSAWLANETGRAQLALDHFEHARELQPDYPPLTLRMADLWLDLDELDQAEAAYREISSEPGLEAAALFGLGQIALLRRDHKTAIEYFTAALDFDPEATRIHYPLAQALRATGRNDEARAQLALRGDRLPAVKDPFVTELKAMKSRAVLHFLRAMKAIHKHDYPAAREAFSQGLKLEPDNATARVSFARTLYLTDHRDAARRELETAVSQQTDNVLGLFLLGVMAEEEGDSAMATRYYLQVLDHAPAHGGAHFYLANHYYREGDFTAAAGHYARAFEDDHRNVPARMLYLAILDQTGAPDDRIRRSLETAVRQLPEQPMFKLQLIQILATAEDPEVTDPQEALRLAQQLAGQQAIPPYREALALAYAASGDFEQAAAIQEEVMSFAVWSMPAEADRLGRGLESYRQGRMPPEDALPKNPPMQPPPLDGAGPFRDYPAARPY